ncbi:hypothetical protein NLI96_g5516 [Meripilus lineatus]|uniref:Association with the SNF1 complex (ASC) domain-containing protein n=1 Tax=Meripilus lineatus TaxID=2056292 RepID=A0AAD5YIY9_9APHY|nr:hypothetical protein NLI96_g5516 [Physisporinus lineatus]
MGNSTSNQVNPINAIPQKLDSPPRRTSPIRGGSPTPSSHRVHKSLYTKKKSLELPDLASLAFTSASPTPVQEPRVSSPIPIPIPISQDRPQTTFRPQNNLPSAAHVPWLRGNSSVQGFRQHHSYLDQSVTSFDRIVGAHADDSPPREPTATKPPFVQEIVNSTLPVSLKQESDLAKPEPITVTIKWSPNTNAWTTPVQLLPGTHHFKFIVDDQWRIADDYPTAVDDRDGSLANYVNVTLPSSSSSPQTPAPTSPMSSPHHHTQSGQLSFWSESTATAGTQFGGGPLGSVKEAEWTTVIPPELIAASGEEENYLTTADSSASSTSIPAPNIPPAPLLPRHLDKLILNVRPATVTGAVPSSGSSSGDKERSSRKGGSRSHRNRERDRDRDRDRTEREARPRPTSNLGMTSTSSNTNATLVSSIPEGTLPIVTASGTDVTALASGPPTPNPGESASEQTSGATTPSIAGGARKVTVASLGGPGLADDASVLPVPSHVVLHHLSTSAIRNGVLAVANTTRYKKKYITTIYYKSTQQSQT